MGFIIASSKAELLQTVRQCVRELVDPKELDAVVQFLQIQRRNLVRLLLPRGNAGGSYYCPVCVPRDSYSSVMRQKNQPVRMIRLGTASSKFWTLFSDSHLVRVCSF